MRGGLIIALIVSAIVAFGFYSAAQMVAKEISRIGPASANVEGVGAAGGTITGGAGDRAGRRLRYGQVTFRTHDGADI